MRIAGLLFAVAASALAAESDRAERERMREEILQRETQRIAAIERAEAEKKREQVAVAAVLAVSVEIISVANDGILARPIGDARKGPPKVAKGVEPIGARPDAATRRGMGSGAVYSRTVTVDARPRVSLPPTVFISGSFDNVYDGKRIALMVWPAGTYLYTSVMNAKKTVLKLTTNFEESEAAAPKTKPAR
jgi:hypothetical protein